MKTLIGDLSTIKYAAQLIKDDQLVIFPTETVYGIGANALSEAAVSKIYQAKGRPSDNPLIVHVDSLEMMKLVTQSISDDAKRLVDQFMPGPLTIILPKSELVASSVAPNLKTVAVRIPDHPIALALIKEAGVPIAAPSANLSTRLSTTTAQHAFEDFDGKVALILDGGECQVGIESTVIDLTQPTPVILRPGRIKLSEILKVIPDCIINTNSDVALAPGMKYKHYAPKVKTLVVDSTLVAKNEYQDNIKLNPVIIGNKEFINQCFELTTISLGATASEVEANYFKVLREAEKYHQCLIVQLYESNDYQAINNRILKAK
jgi:L-threonylcarbamoyladenylate synthase